MAEFFAGAQALAANDLVAFAGQTKRCANVVHRDGSGLFTLKGGSGCNPARYMVHVHVVATAPAAVEEQLMLYVDGEPITASLIALPAVAVETQISGGTTLMIESACGCTKLSLHAITAVGLASAIINIDRVA